MKIFYSFVVNLNLNILFKTSYRWNAVVLDGHNVEALCRAFHDAEQSKDRPTMILAKTFKGKGIYFLSFWDKILRHYVKADVINTETTFGLKTCLTSLLFHNCTFRH